MAARLSEDPDVTVLLLEAGQEHNQSLINIPARYPDIQLTELDWQFRSVRQPHQLDRVSHWPRGKVLGGCSSINAMVYVRGNPENYDNWAKDGCDGWSYREVLPYFKKSENCLYPGVERCACELNDAPAPPFMPSSLSHLSILSAHSDYHGKGGPLTVDVTTRGEANEMSLRFLKAAAKCGIPITKDYNGSSQVGGSLSQVTIKDGVRHSTAHAFLDPIRDTRKNLTIATEVHVTRYACQPVNRPRSPFFSAVLLQCSFPGQARGGCDL